MNTRLCLCLRRRRLFKLVDRRAQERSTLIAPIALYSATMSQLEADRQGQLMLLRTASAAFPGHLCRSSTLHGQLLVGAGGLKLHSLSGRGFVQPGLSAIRHYLAAGNA